MAFVIGRGGLTLRSVTFLSHVAPGHHDYSDHGSFPAAPVTHQNTLYNKSGSADGSRDSSSYNPPTGA
jgi:hypothetical protein